jgi:hypothetical protein
MDHGYGREAHPKPRILRSSGNKSNDESFCYKEKEQNNTLRSRISQERTNNTKIWCKNDFSLNSSKIHTPRRSPPSLPRLIGMKNMFSAHFYTTNAKMKFGSGKEPHPI